MERKLTTEEKMRLLSGVGWWHTYEIEEAGLPALFMCDGPHGLRIQQSGEDHLGIHESERAVCYPTESTVACSFDKDLLRELGKMLGKEALQAKVDMVLGPGVNIKRTPLCGRNFEYYSEDPVVSGELGAAFAEGMQSVGVSVCVKHFACNNVEYRRNFSDSRLDERTLREIYLKAFEIIVKRASPYAVMCAYNLVNGVYCSENEHLLTDILRKEWGYKGIVVSDWGAVNNAPRSVKAGLDLEMPFAGGFEALKSAYADGALSEKEIDAAAERVERFIRTCVRNRKYRKEFSFSRHEALQLARTAAAESAVLMKNERAFFPILPTEKILVVGEVAEVPRFQGGGSSHINAGEAVSLLTALREAGVNHDHTKGYDLASGEIFPVQTDGYDKIIFAVGLRDSDESEGYDRSDLKLPPCIDALLNKAMTENVRCGVLIFTGGAVELPWAKRAEGIIFCGLPGECGTYGIVDVLTGKICPSGKLTETWVKKERDLYTHSKAKGNGKVVEYHEGVFVGYRYYEAKGVKPLFAFGHGLSYTSFSYSRPVIQKTEKGIRLSFFLKNIGSVSGKETVMLFVKYPRTDEPRPLKVLLDFQKTQLQPTEGSEVVFEIDREGLAVYDKNGCRYLPGGDYTFYVCSASDEIRGSAKISMEGKAQPVTQFTLMSEIWTDKKRRKIFQTMILDRLLPLFGLKELPENTKRILMESPLKSFRGIAPSVITTELLNQVIDMLNEQDQKRERKSEY